MCTSETRGFGPMVHGSIQVDDDPILDRVGKFPGSRTSSTTRCAVKTRRQRCQRTSPLRSPATLQPRRPRSDLQRAVSDEKGILWELNETPKPSASDLKPMPRASLCVTMTTDLIPVTRQPCMLLSFGPCTPAPFDITKKKLASKREEARTKQRNPTTKPRGTNLRINP